jgi:hypothetical protein
MSVERRQERPERTAPDALPMSRQIEAAMQRAVRQALRRHKLLGESVAVSDEQGKVVILSPEEIPDFPEDEPPARA